MSLKSVFFSRPAILVILILVAGTSKAQIDDRENEFRLPNPVIFNPDTPECKAWVEAYRFCDDNLESERIAQNILNNVQFISFSDLAKSLLNQLLGLKDQLTHFKKEDPSSDRILVPIENGKSSGWIVARGSPVDVFLSRYRVDYVERAHIVNDVNSKHKLVLFVDDAIYSGAQMSAMIPTVIKYFEEANVAPPKIRVVVGAAADEGIKRVTSAAKVQLNGFMRLRGYFDVLGKDAGQYWRLFARDGIPPATVSILEHKVPDSFSTLAAFRDGYVSCSSGLPPNEIGYLKFSCFPIIVPPYKTELESSMKVSELDCCHYPILKNIEACHETLDRKKCAKLDTERKRLLKEIVKKAKKIKKHKEH